MLSSTGPSWKFVVVGVGTRIFSDAVLAGMEVASIFAGFELQKVSRYWRRGFGCHQRVTDAERVESKFVCRELGK